MVVDMGHPFHGPEETRHFQEAVISDGDFADSTKNLSAELALQASRSK